MPTISPIHKTTEDDTKRHTVVHYIALGVVGRQYAMEFSDKALPPAVLDVAD